MPASKRLVLASNSPRRRELLTLTGWTFSVSPADIDETPRPGENSFDYVSRLSREKAHACPEKTADIVLAADTIVVDGEELLGKPEYRSDAFRMLRKLRGHEHRVMTAIVIFDRETGKVEQDVCVTTVPMRNYSDAEILSYVESDDPMDKAGAYAIQHAGFHPVENFNGCFASVMGLPLCHLRRLAGNFGMDVSQNLVSTCERINDYTCPIHQLVESGIRIG
ncbi:MAG: septum formation protein Maf [Chloroflexi bacterium]|nr:septum formation protein Maf [Chloroflexota bacterium]